MVTEITPSPGKLGDLYVGTGDSAGTEVGGVLSVDPGLGWDTEKPMYLQDDAPRILKNYQTWSMTVKVKYDKTDPGQKIMEDCFDSDTTHIMVKYMTDATNYREAHGIVTKFVVPVDPKIRNEATITIDPVGEALTAGP
jgi:hypothetical protein